ncbi:hypothetical protein Tco_1115364 [Tanacetum coccineum]
METKSFISRLDKVSSPEEDYLVVYRVNGNFRGFNYLMEVLHIVDRQDLFHLYELITRQYLEVTLEGYELILWGDLKIMMESSMEHKTGRLSLGDCMKLVEMLDLGLEVERESIVALDLIRFIKQQINEN